MCKVGWQRQVSFLRKIYHIDFSKNQLANVQIIKKPEEIMKNKLV